MSTSTPTETTLLLRTRARTTALTLLAAILVSSTSMAADPDSTVSSNRPVYFGTEVVPILTKLGCNGGGCHGKATGQNGFRLSLFGFEPEFDYEAIVKESRGRRLSPAAPEHSPKFR